MFCVAPAVITFCNFTAGPLKNSGFEDWFISVLSQALRA
jgi:predicted dehydrogenase